LRNTGLLFFLFLLTSTFTYGQVSYRLGAMPAINLNKGLKRDWDLNLKWESRQSILSGQPGESAQSRLAYQLSDLSLLGAKKVGLSEKVAFGMLFRIREEEVLFRSIQQFILVRSYGSFRLAHRLAADQTFGKNTPTEYRLRYRIATELPLSGATVNIRELYFKANHEYLLSLQKNTFDLEARLVPHLGYVLTDRNKLELGLDYRLDGFLQQATRHTAWIRLNWYLKL
jgi:hypothetical protein